jgi:hypothetical protein
MKFISRIDPENGNTRPSAHGNRKRIAGDIYIGDPLPLLKL